MSDAVLLLAHGAPERVEDVESYLAQIRGGRPGSAQVVEEVKHRYSRIGGASPLLRWTREQAAALEKLLGIPVFFAMRNWHPFIRDVVPQIRADRVAAVCLAPQYSEMSVGLYMKRTVEAAPDLNLIWARSYHDEPLLIEAFAERLRPLLPAARVLFTAHSLPEKILESGDPYPEECRATAAAVAARVGLASYEFAFQSQGMTSEKWLGPTVECVLDRYAAEGVREAVIDPIGFVCDHVEILYDIDIGFRDYAAARGIAVRRPESLNGSPTFTRALAEVAKRCLAA
ncbi:MAG TPA: ferrochelatase [Bryobacteraceae bacterium]|nr:ferrochelatase [Bryobacteraceae bacterium]